MKTLYLKEQYEDEADYPAMLSNVSDFGRSTNDSKSTFMCLLDANVIEDERITLELRGDNPNWLDSVTDTVANMAAQGFTLHVRPHEHTFEEQGSYRLINVRAAEVVVSEMEERPDRLIPMKKYGAKKIEIIRR